VPETSIKAALRGLGLAILISCDAHADEAPCPPSGRLSEDLPDARKSAEQPSEAVDPAKLPTDVTGDKVEYKVNGNLVLSGNVVMQQGDRKIRADHLEMNPQDRSAKLEGAVEYSDPNLVVRSGSGDYSPTLGASFQGTEFELPGRGARGSATNLKVDGNNKVTLDGVTFTTCPANQVDWQLAAKQIEIDTQTRNGVGRGTKVEFKGVSLIYLPWMTFPVGSQRKSGFLFPEPGGSSRNGAELLVPYYWNIRPNLDFTALPVYYSKRGLDLAGELRYLTSRQRGEFAFNYLPNDDIADRDRARFTLNHVAELPGEWRFRIDATGVSDTDYFEDFARGPEGTSVPFAERLAEATYRDEHLNLRAQVQYFQTIDEELPEEDRPYMRAPRLLASGEWDSNLLGGIEYGFDAEVVNFDRDLGVTGWRLDVAPRVGFDWSGPGYFVRPSAGYRYTQYSLEDQAPGTSDSPTRSLPIATLDAGLVFERIAGSQGQRRLTLEPRALYLYTPFREQDDLPLFDTGLPDLNLVQLFRTNRYVGADRVNDANQIAFGITSRLLDSQSGAQYLAVSLGQAYYFDEPLVVLPDEPPATRDTSDYIAQLSLTAYRNWNLEAGLQWNPEDERSERSQFRLQYRPSGDRVVNLAYRAQRERLEQAEFSAAWPLGDRWNAFGRYVYSLLDSKTLDEFAGFEYKGCCYKLRAVARRSVSNRDGSSESSFYLQLELNGLASVGTTDAFLERAIRGYSPETSAARKVIP
jgi:LPS-assembly protein